LLTFGRVNDRDQALVFAGKYQAREASWELRYEEEFALHAIGLQRSSLRKLDSLKEESLHML
jgi:hypothetical protein